MLPEFLDKSMEWWWFGDGLVPELDDRSEERMREVIRDAGLFKIGRSGAPIYLPTKRYALVLPP